MRRASLAYIPPEFFDSGEIGRQTSQEDEYFKSVTSEQSVRMVVDSFVALLPEYYKTAVEMCVMAGITYEEAAEHISVKRGIRTDKKTVWRWAEQGVKMLQEWLVKSPWVNNITDGKIPVDKIDLTASIQLPGVDDGSQ
jgi:DNA-directed RNA polymerase specialized sigma24 family protein